MWASVCVAATAVSASGEDATPKLPIGFVSEAPLPEGFPPPSETGKIVLKTYPGARTFSASGRNAFFKCFTYLSVHRHKMTAPVVMDYPGGVASDKSPEDAAERMHFVLQRPGLDKPGKRVLVEVADMPKQEVVSLALQGDLTAEKLADGEARLRVYVEGRPDLSIADALRVLGYNSPMVMPEKRFWEIQFPVQRVKRD